jgi:hypothetical protein
MRVFDYIENKLPLNKPAAANPAIASRFHGRRLWRGVAEPGR